MNRDRVCALDLGSEEGPEGVVQADALAFEEPIDAAVVVEGVSDLPAGGVIASHESGQVRAEPELLALTLESHRYFCGQRELYLVLSDRPNYGKTVDVLGTPAAPPSLFSRTIERRSNGLIYEFHL